MSASWRIMVLEDDEDLRDALATALQLKGHTVAAVASGDEALALARRSKVDLLVTVVRMAGMDGLQTLEKMKVIYPELKSIVITGYASDDAPTRAIDLEASDYLYKPFGPNDLLNSVHRVMEAPAERQGYEKLLGDTVARFRKVVAHAASAVTTAIASSQLATLEGLRDRAFQGFYVAVRSAKLDLDKALYEWSTLEKLEADREDLKTPGVHIKQRQELEEGYRYLVDLNRALSTTDRVYAFGKPIEGSMSAGDFRPFYLKVRQGRISAELVMMGPFLRTLDEFALRQSTELKNLYDQVWGVAEHEMA